MVRADAKGRCCWCVGAWLVATCASGCSLNDRGALAARISHGDGALVYTSFAPGFALHARGDERAASLGFAVRTCIAALTADAPPAGLYYALPPPRPAHCYARHLTTWGGELRASAPDYSLSLGYRDTALLAVAGEQPALDYRLDYDVARPSTTHLEVLSP